MAIFQSPKNIFQRPKFPGKCLKFRRKSDIRQISGSEIWKFRARKNAIPYPQPFHTPTRLPPINLPSFLGKMARIQTKEDLCGQSSSFWRLFGAGARNPRETLLQTVSRFSSSSSMGGPERGDNFTSLFQVLQTLHSKRQKHPFSRWHAENWKGGVTKRGIA